LVPLQATMGCAVGASPTPFTHKTILEKKEK
jgi:hypothetical protein